nr:MAG TPA: hypothetical protein [Caudoviricetes sp.]
MSKTLENLVEKALKTGSANLNGRMRAYGYIGKLESKYKIHYNKDIDTFVLYHWGTCILTIKNLHDKPIVTHFYGQSKSDRDALTYIFNRFETGYSASYRPSIGEFSVTANFGTGKLETRAV